MKSLSGSEGNRNPTEKGAAFRIPIARLTEIKTIRKIPDRFCFFIDEQGL